MRDFGRVARMIASQEVASALIVGGNAHLE